MSISAELARNRAAFAALAGLPLPQEEPAPVTIPQPLPRTPLPEAAPAPSRPPLSANAYRITPREARSPAGGGSSPAEAALPPAAHAYAGVDAPPPGGAVIPPAPHFPSGEAQPPLSGIDPLEQLAERLIAEARLAPQACT